MCVCVCMDVRDKEKRAERKEKNNPEGRKEGRKREGPNRLVSTGLHVVERVSEHRSFVQ